MASWAHVILNSSVDLGVPEQVLRGQEHLVAGLAAVLWAALLVYHLDVTPQVGICLEVIAAVLAHHSLLGGVYVCQVLVQVRLGLEESPTLRTHVLSVFPVDSLGVLVSGVLMFESLSTDVTQVLLLCAVDHLVEPQLRRSHEVPGTKITLEF